MSTSMKKLPHRIVTIVAAGLVLVLLQAGPTAASPLAGFAERSVTTADGDTFHLKLAAAPITIPSTGETVAVAGTSYNTAQGMFLASCVIPEGVRLGDPTRYTALPTPCLGGRESTDGSARRITDSATGTPGVTIPYRPVRSFLTTLSLRSKIADGTVRDVDVRCAIVTRADLMATDDRTHDQYIPVHCGR